MPDCDHAIKTNLVTHNKTTVGINSWVAHHNESIFGPDVDSFNPERWLRSEEDAKRMDRYFLEVGSLARPMKVLC